MTEPIGADDGGGAGLREVYVVLTGGGRLLGDRHYRTAEAAAAALQAAGVPGVVLTALVAP